MPLSGMPYSRDIVRAVSGPDLSMRRSRDRNARVRSDHVSLTPCKERGRPNRSPFAGTLCPRAFGHPADFNIDRSQHRCNGQRSDGFEGAAASVLDADRVDPLSDILQSE